jgi:phage shock protein PspC (stress-responsive transcriptional regulator)
MIPGMTEKREATEDEEATTPTTERPEPRKLYRRVDNKMVAGVAAGLGDYFAVDPIFFRIAFVVLTITGGVGVVAYLLLWWLVPPSAQISNPAEDTVRRLKDAPMWVAVILLVIGAALLADQAGWWRPDLVWGAALIGLGVLLFYESRGQRAGTTPAGYATAVASPEARTVPGPPAGPGAPDRETSLGGPAARGVPPPWAFATGDHPPVAVKRRDRSGLGLATIGVALLVTGMAALLDNAGLFSLSLAQYLALPLVILGLGLMIGSWVGRARWLLILAVPLVGLTLLTGLVTVPLQGGFGDRLLQPTTAQAADRPFRMIAGRMVIDLSTLSRHRSANVNATVVAGTIEVIVRRHTRLDIRAEMGAGEIALLGGYHDGLKLSERRRIGPPGGPRLFIHVAASFGRIVVFWR